MFKSENVIEGVPGVVSSHLCGVLSLTDHACEGAWRSRIIR